MLVEQPQLCSFVCRSSLGKQRFRFNSRSISRPNINKRGTSIIDWPILVKKALDNRLIPIIEYFDYVPCIREEIYQTLKRLISAGERALCRVKNVENDRTGNVERSPKKMQNQVQMLLWS